MYKFLFKHIDNSGLVVFRIIFGLLCFLEAAGAVFTGWVKRTLVEPDFTFTFIGFEWLQPLPGNWMYAYYIVMSLFGLLVMLGYKYRFSMLMYALKWTAVYLMQKTSYNNHYYFLMLLCYIMVFMPANRYASLDVKLNPNLKQISMPSWCKWFFVLQLFILYTYASIAKLYPDWLDGSVITLLMKGKAHYPIIGDLLQNKTLHYFIAYGGILYDGLIIPLLLYKPTSKYAFFASIFFHLFNSIVFQVGIFPYLALAFSLFFFSPKTVRNIFLKKKPLYNSEEVIVPKTAPILLMVFSIYFTVQIALPLRHHFIKDNVLWTDEAHKMSWRMMLRSRSGYAIYSVVDKETNKKTYINLDDYVSKKQTSLVSAKPDAMRHFAQYLKKEFAKEVKEISVFLDCKVRVYGKHYKP